MEANLPATVTTLFRRQILPALWKAAVDYGIDPVGMVAQSGKETGWGTYMGQVHPEFHNTCGLKVSPAQQALFPGVTDGDRPLAHHMAASWAVGARQHAEHLHSWCGTRESAMPDPILDPRWQSPRSLLDGVGPAVTWADLGGRWAPSPTYGLEIEATMRILTGTG